MTTAEPVTITPQQALACARAVLTRSIDGAPEPLSVEQAVAVRAALFDAHATIARLRAEIGHAKKRAEAAASRHEQLVEQVVSEEHRAVLAESALAAADHLLDESLEILVGWTAAPADGAAHWRHRARVVVTDLGKRPR